jgi:hypothetical protein
MWSVFKGITVFVASEPEGTGDTVILTEVVGGLLQSLQAHA